MLLVDIYYGFGAMLHENFSVAIFYWTSRDFRNLRNLLQKGCGSFPSCRLCHALVSGGTWASWMWDSSKRDVSVACAKHLLEAMRGILSLPMLVVMCILLSVSSVCQFVAFVTINESFWTVEWGVIAMWPLVCQCGVFGHL